MPAPPSSADRPSDAGTQPASGAAATAPAGGGPAQPADRGLAGAVRAVSGMTLLSRFGGLLRDVLVGRIFGDAAVGSAFASAFAIPNMFRRLFGEGALSAAFIPEYAAALRSDPSQAARLASLTVAALGLGAAALTVVLEVALLVLVVALPFDAERDLSLRLTMVMLPFMPMICSVAILAGMLQVHGRFGPAASGPLMLNAFIVAVAGWCLLRGQAGGPGVAYALGVATTLSGATQLAWFARLLRPHVRWTRDVRAALPAARRMLARFGPVVLGMGTLQLSALMDMLVAMWPLWVGPTVLGTTYPLDDASYILLNLAQRLYQFPLGVFGVAVATAAFPLLAKHAAEPAAFAETLRRGLRLSLFIGLPASVGLVLVRHDVVATLYGGGALAVSPEGLARMAAVVAGFAPAIWAYSLNHVLTRAFYAQGDTVTPMKIALAAVGLNLLLNLGLIWPLKEAGLAWSTSAAATAQCAALWWALGRRLPPETGVLLDRSTRAGFARTAGLTAGMAGATAAVLWLWPLELPRALGEGVAGPPAPGPAWASWAARLAALVAVGGGSYLVGAAAAKSAELRWLVGRGGHAA